MIPHQVPPSMEKFYRSLLNHSAEECFQIGKQKLAGAATEFFQAAIALRLAEEKGKDINELRGPTLTMLRRIAYGQLLPELYSRFLAARCLHYVAKLSIPEQQSLVNGEKVKLLVRQDGQTTSLDVLADELTVPQAAQVFASDHIRNEAEQARWLVERQAMLRPSREIAGVEIDRRGKRILVSGNQISLSRKALARLLAELES